MEHTGHTYDGLSKMTVAQLREIAHGVEHEALHGHMAMHKEKLLLVLCQALGIDAHAHHEVVGVNKTEIKAQIRRLKAERDTAIGAHDSGQLKAVRRKIHHLKRELHKATV